MLRDKNLVPLSHQHQRALALCVRLDRAMQAGELDREAWQAEIQQAFEQEIRVHFAAEEKEVFPAAVKFANLQALVEELRAEHADLRNLFLQAQTRSLSALGLQEFVERLAQHIRKEERQLFEGLQALMSPEELAAVGAALEKALVETSKSCAIPTKATRPRPKP
jgi:hemerythrin-like domain-containing protein